MPLVKRIHVNPCIFLRDAAHRQSDRQTTDIDRITSALVDVINLALCPTAGCRHLANLAAWSKISLLVHPENVRLQRPTFRRFAAKYYHLFLLKMVSVIFAVLDVSF